MVDVAGLMANIKAAGSGQNVFNMVDALKGGAI
jgi:hypothetical protein